LIAINFCSDNTFIYNGTAPQSYIRFDPAVNTHVITSGISARTIVGDLVQTASSSAYPWSFTGNSITNQTAGSGGFRIMHDTTTDTATYYFVDTDGIYPMMDKSAMLRKHIKNNLLIKVNRRNSGVHTGKWSLEEGRARDTLRDMLTEKDWRRYVTNGFIMVKGYSNNWYQIFSNKSEKIRVYRNGIHTHNICIHTDNICPPTDHVINMKIRVELDEMSLWEGGNIYPISGDSLRKTRSPVFQNSAKCCLLETFKRIKEPNSDLIHSVTGTIYNSLPNQFALAC